MERRAASHTEEEEMNQRRRLLNAAKKGDPKAINKLFELYQVRIFSGEMVNKLNRAAGLHKQKGAHLKPGKGRGLSKKAPLKAVSKAKPRSKHGKVRPRSVKPKKAKKSLHPKKSKKR
jgi:hypothetical protein